MSEKNEEYLQMLELTIEHAQEIIARKAAVIALTKSNDYKLIFSEGYFKDFAVNQVLLKADASQQTPEDQETISKNIDAIGTLYMYLHNIISMGKEAEKSLEEANVTREEIMNEEEDDDNG